MFKKFSLADLRIHHLAWCAVVAVALAGCGGDNTVSTSAPSSSGTGAGAPPPIIRGTPPTSVDAGIKYQYIPSASDPDSRPLSYDIINKPDWATFVALTGELYGTPETSDVGTTAEIEIGVSDGTERAIVGPFRIRINPGRPHYPPPGVRPTIFGKPAAAVTAGQPYNFRPEVINPSLEKLSFAIVNRPAWATFSTLTGQLSGTPTTANEGVFANILISVTGGYKTSSLPLFSIRVQPAANDAPTIAGTPATRVVAGNPYSFTPVAADPEGHALTFSILNAPPWASFSASSGQLSGRPPTAAVGIYSNIVITASDGSLTASLPAFWIQVQAPTNDTPRISGTPATSVVAGSAYSFKPDATDPAGKGLVFSIQAMPSWANFSSSTGRLSGIPAAADVGAFPGIVITVSDGNEHASLPAFSIQVKAVPDHAPVIAGAPPASVVAGHTYSFRPTASDPDGNALTFSVANLPSWASFSSATGQLSGTPTRAQVGTFSNIVISVSDGTQSTALPAFSIQVDAPADQAPVIGGTPNTSVVAGTVYAFTPTASDPNGDALTFSVANRPSWANFNSSTGELSGTPSAANVGTFANIVISVSDGTLSASLPAFAIVVATPVNPPPTISGTPATSVNAGSAYSFTPTAADPNGNTLTFSVNNLPSWAAFNAHSGMLSGIPANRDAGTYANIVISVSDGTSSAALPAFAIVVVAPVNPPPTISGTPATSVNAGSAYSFTPTAADHKPAPPHERQYADIQRQ